MRRIGSRAVSWVVVAAVTAMLSPVSMAFAAAWNVPTNVRVVQKSNTDTTGRIYGNVQAAINSITNASVTNPYVVKVMPGVYDLGTASLQMKPFVDLEGSGPDNTILTSSNAGPQDCSTGAVIMANNSTIKNIKIVNIPPVGSGADEANGLVFYNVKAKAEGVSVIIGNDVDSAVYSNVGVCVGEENSNATLNNMYIEAHNVGNQTRSLKVQNGGQLFVTNSRIVSNNITREGKLINTMASADPSVIGKISVLNTKFESNAGGYTNLFFFDGVDVIIKDSLIIYTNSGTSNPADTDMLRNQGTATVKISGTKIISNVPVHYENYGGIFQIDNSQLPGDYSSLQGDPTVKLFNNYNDAYNAIPNQ